jgi:hypothetical protein
MPDGYRTRTELAERALSALGVLAAGQSPAVEDVTLIDGLIEPMLATLAAREVVDGIDPDLVPDEHFVELGLILAERAAVDFGVAAGDPENPATIAFKAAKAEMDLRVMNRSRPTYQALEVEYY